MRFLYRVAVHMRRFPIEMGRDGIPQEQINLVAAELELQNDERAAAAAAARHGRSGRAYVHLQRGRQVETSHQERIDAALAARRN